VAEHAVARLAAAERADAIEGALTVVALAEGPARRAV
jgi:hypothetical protein